MAAGGKALAAGLIAGARQAGVDLWLNSPLKELVVEHGKVTGVVVEKQGRLQRLAAKGGVILAMGGFDHDGEKHHKYQSEALTEDWSFGNPDNTGDMFAIADQVGAGLALLSSQAWWFPAIPPLTPGPTPIFMLSERSLPGSMIVDSTGHRFFNEASDYMTAGRAMLGLDDGKGHHLPMWLIFDQAYRNRYLFAGAVMPRMPITKVFYDSGVVVKADSIAELSRKIEVPGLVDGAARFNLLASQGQDDDFKRGLGHYDRSTEIPRTRPTPTSGPSRRRRSTRSRPCQPTWAPAAESLPTNRAARCARTGCRSTDSTPWATPPPMLLACSIRAPAQPSAKVSCSPTWRRCTLRLAPEPSRVSEEAGIPEGR